MAIRVSCSPAAVVLGIQFLDCRGSERKRTGGGGTQAHDSELPGRHRNRDQHPSGLVVPAPALEFSTGMQERHSHTKPGFTFALTSLQRHGGCTVL